MENLQPLFGIYSGNSSTSKTLFVIAGSCSAESHVQVMELARGLKSAGIEAFRAGVWKPRTHPGQFEGRGEEALEWLSDVQKTVGLKVLTEVGSADHLREIAKAGLDGFWIGARTTANPFVVQEISDEFEKLPADIKERMTVLVKNPVNPDLELWIGALERLYKAGARRLGAIHRGFSYYSPTPSDYRNAPYWPIPIELKRRYPNLPLIFDPSHTGGKRELVGPLSRQALEIGFDGLMVEVHDNPENALSDSGQQITTRELDKLITSLRAELSRNESGCNDSSISREITRMRSEIDTLDREILELIARRMEIVSEMGILKKQGGMSVVQPTRYAELIERRRENGIALGLAPDFVKKIFTAIHEESVEKQLKQFTR